MTNEQQPQQQHQQQQQTHQIHRQRLTRRRTTSTTASLELNLLQDDENELEFELESSAAHNDNNTSSLSSGKDRHKQQQQQQQVQQRDHVHFLSTLFAGVGSGALSSFICAPLDLIRTRMQVWGEIQDKQGNKKKITPGEAFRTIIKKEGPKGIFRGLVSSHFSCYFVVLLLLLLLRQLKCYIHINKHAHKLFSFFLVFANQNERTCERYQTNTLLFKTCKLIILGCNIINCTIILGCIFSIV